MQLTSILAVSTALLAAQVPAQGIHPAVPSLSVWRTPSPSPSPSPTVASDMATPAASSSKVAQSSASHYMAHHSFRPMVKADAQSHSSMRPVASPSSSHSQYIASAATPSPSSQFGTQNQKQHQGLRMPAAQGPVEPAALHGGLAPVDPLMPGSDVAPVLMQKPHGKDEGNSFCMGQCYPSKGDAHCSKPYAWPLYKEANDCWMCCVTAGDF
ncbi:uncharacterized protein N7482_007745 [Penicillium canariense]|uniref:Uncharacterized protein n=1 Tax=Penicillium canariense TaxID=189055 RepID=A0A9W9LKW1_9EURO|nr:uncharacterized protein N7482_007745 [Penicillium canariense]KAJ5160741.1 hypothetical protein N7482_007745 [Penicillium canariense]